MPAKEKEQIEVLMSGVRHINEQAFGADSSAPIYESVDNPAFSDDGRRGMLIERVRIYPKNATPIIFATGSPYNWVTQIQSGTRTTIVEITDLALVMQGQAQLTFLTGIGVQLTKMWPFELDSVIGAPLIVAPTFSVLHDVEINHVAFASKTLYTVIDYSVVEVPDTMFRTLYMNQTRTS